MKKSLIALAVLAAASGAAMAQSSVTLFGVVDANLQYLDASNYDAVSGKGGTVWKLANSGYNSSRLGFRGTEDLGGGLNASFWLEAGVNNDNGTGSATSTNNSVSTTATGGAQGLTFNRRSTVSLAGNWGEVRLGRDYVPFFWNTTIFDPFGTNGVASATNFTTAGLGALAGNTSSPTAVRASNSVGYFMPNIAGFYGQAMYAMGENNRSSAAKNDGNVGSVRVGYANGPVDVAFGWGQTWVSAAQKYEVMNLGASWNFGMFKLMGLANWEAADVTTGLYTGQNLKSKSYLIGATMPLGAGELKASYIYGNSSYDLTDGSQIAIGYVYNLSKRTALYTTYAHINNSGNNVNAYAYNNGLAPAGAKNNTQGFDFGVRHSF
jgi:predicted porin